MEFRCVFQPRFFGRGIEGEIFRPCLAEVLARGGGNSLAVRIERGHQALKMLARDGGSAWRRAVAQAGDRNDWLSGLRILLTAGSDGDKKKNECKSFQAPHHS